jgi:cation diffusion facilitator CzcD-associated flavoprotein CzcO
MGFYAFCRKLPGAATRLLVHHMKQRAGVGVDAQKHFTPRYRPWDQRVCLVPDDDLFDAFRRGVASIVTDHIERITEKGVRLRSGEELEADLIVTATGLKLKFLGGMKLDVDGRAIHASDVMVYKGAMVSDVPNMAFALGYTNASWTLKCDLTSEYVCRLIRHLDENGYTYAIPRASDPTLRPEPMIDFTSGYVQRALASVPRQGSRAPWKLYQNYIFDLALLRRGAIDDGFLELGRTEKAEQTSTARAASPT